MNEIVEKGVPYSQRCEFCATQPGIAILHAENQVVPTFSVRSCAKCFGRLIQGHSVLDIFGWLWKIDLDGTITAKAVFPAHSSPGPRDESRDPPDPEEKTLEERTEETRDLIRDLGKALRDYHLGLHTTQSLARTYGRDESLLFRVTNWLREDDERGVPVTTEMFTIGKVRRDIRDGLLPSYTTRELLELAAWLRERATEASESTGSARELVRDLVRALAQHVNPGLNPMNEDIRGRDVALVARGMEWLGKRDEKGVPVNIYDNPVKCIKCDSQATWLVNELPYCVHHAEPRAQWLLEHEGVVSRFHNELGFMRVPVREYIPVKEDERERD